ncbi:hypothetical protein F5B20DRAFT_388116 [Whalleya microplaca]|nr:hypothetical protein F5B20DRAFT_388116 [Whalleya microplaca]
MCARLDFSFSFLFSSSPSSAALLGRGNWGPAGLALNSEAGGMHWFGTGGGKGRFLSVPFFFLLDDGDTVCRCWGGMAGGSPRIHSHNPGPWHALLSSLWADLGWLADYLSSFR